MRNGIIEILQITTWIERSWQQHKNYSFPAETKGLLPNLGAQPAPRCAPSLPCEGGIPRRYFRGSCHPFAQRAIGVGKLHHNSKVVCQLLSEPFKLLRMRHRLVCRRRRKDLQHGPIVGAKRERRHFHAHNGAGPYLFEFPVAHEHSRFHHTAIDDLTELISGRKVLTSLTDCFC